MLRVDERLDVFRLAAALRRRGRHQRIEKMLRRLGRFGHLVGQIPGRVVRKSQQRGFFRAQLRQAGNRRARVVGVAAARRGSRSSQRSPGAWRDRLRDARTGCCVVFCSGISQSVLLARLRVLGGGGDLRIAQPGERLYVRGRERARLGRREQLVGKRVFERRLFFVELLQLGLVGVGEIGAGFHKLLVVVLDEPQRLGIEMERRALVVDRLHARKELGVQIDGVLMRGQARSFVLLHLLQLIVVFAPVTQLNAGHHAREQLAAALQRDDGVFKGGRRGIVGDGLHLVDLLRHARVNGRLVVAVLDLVEGRRLKRQSARRVKGIARTKVNGGGRGLRGDASGAQSNGNSGSQNAPLYPFDMKRHHGDMAPRKAWSIHS